MGAFVNRANLLDFKNNTKHFMLAIAILAAGKGTRMKSALPKVLQPLSGKTLIERVLDCCNALQPDRKIIVIGHEAKQIRSSLKDYEDIEFVLQQHQNGTGHAVQNLQEPLSKFKGDLLVLNGDVPLLTETTLKRLLDFHRKSIESLGETSITTNGSSSARHGPGAPSMGPVRPRPADQLVGHPFV